MVLGCIIGSETAIIWTSSTSMEFSSCSSNISSNNRSNKNKKNEKKEKQQQSFTREQYFQEEERLNLGMIL